MDPVRTVLRTDPLLVTAEIVETLIGTGGYVHPLFTGATGSPPLPGQGVLLLLGGMLERSGVLDHAVALLGFEDVRFHTMVRAGDEINVELELVGERSTSGRFRIEIFTWKVHNQHDEKVLDARAQMLVRQPETTMKEQK